jgi:hypothetical protein
MHDEKLPGRTLLRNLVSSCLMSRRLEDRIRELCALAVSCTDSTQLNTVLHELTAALHEQIERMRKFASQRSFPSERRQRVS